jgi:hypothetical protein
MVQRGEYFGLALEPGETLGITRDRGWQHLDGDGALQRGVGGAIDLAHTASPEGTNDFVAADACAWGE